jgi:RNA polymerase sigma-70 factor, ECF subfamily
VHFLSIKAWADGRIFARTALPESWPGLGFARLKPFDHLPPMVNPTPFIPLPASSFCEDRDESVFLNGAMEEAPRLLSQAIALCGDQSLAEDLVQETIVEAWKCRHRFDGSCRLSTWLHAILMHRHHKALRHARLRPFFCLNAEARDEAMERLQAMEGSPSEACEQDERAGLVRRCVNALPAKQREVLVLRFFGDASLEEIARATGVSLGTVKSRLFHALEKFKKTMNLSGL